MTNSLPDYGGDSLNDQRLVCPSGEIGTGIYGRAGTAIDQLGLICEKWVPEGAVANNTGGAGGDPVPPDWADMLAAHNAARNAHCSPPLTWSAQLAAAAQQWAKQCTNTHDSGGENLALFFAADAQNRPILPATSDRNAFQQTWYCEAQWYNFDKPQIVGGFKNGCQAPVNGHFTQVVWKSTRQLGCARQTCNINGQTGTYWVCKYAPAGNDPNALTQNVLRQRPICQ